MKRLIATLILDYQLQSRYLVYTIVVLVAIAVASALHAMFDATQLHFFMPLIILSGVSLTTIFLVGLLILLERDEGTLDVILVSPLRVEEYLASKLISLTFLALLESALLAVICFGLGFTFGWLVFAVVLRGATCVAVGVAISVRFRSITNFLPPAILASALFDIPILWYVELWPSSIVYLWPSMPSLLLAKAAFFDVTGSEIIYASLYGLVAAAGALFWALRSLNRFVIGGKIQM
jgi:fluoroquinolone transport system permease protein